MNTCGEMGHLYFVPNFSTEYITIKIRKICYIVAIYVCVCVCVCVCVSACGYIHTHSGILVIKNETLPFAAT